MVSRPVLSASMALLCLLGALLSGWGDASTVHSILDDYKVLTGEGYYTLQINKSPQTDALAPLRNDQCRVLRTAAGVVAAGGAVPLDGVRLATPTGPIVGAWRADPDLLKAASWAATSVYHTYPLRTQGAVFDDSVVARFGGIDDRTLVSLHRGEWTTEVEGVSGTTGVLGGGFRDSILIAADLDQIDVCVVVVRPDERSTVEREATALFPTSHGYLKSWALRTDPTFQSPSERLRSRVTRFAGLTFGTITGAVLAALAYARRHDASTYRLLGLSRRKTAQLIGIQLAIPAAGGIAISTLLYLAYSRGDFPAGRLSGWLQLATYLVLVSLMITLIAMSLARHDVIGSLKDQ